MNYTEAEIQQALDACAQEPVHIPGIVQTFAALIAVQIETRRVEYASENCADILGLKHHEILGHGFSDIADRHIWHEVCNAAAAAGAAAGATVYVGRMTINTRELDVSLFQSGDYYVLELEAPSEQETGRLDGLGLLRFLTKEVQEATTLDDLYNRSTRILRDFTGYERVMVYRFDPEFNGEVIAETRSTVIEPFLGLHFPSSDIPVQARAIMQKVTLRFLADTEAETAPLVSCEPDLAPLDMTQATARGTSPIHIQYLRNMGVRSTMTLSVLSDGELWGMISLHHRGPKMISREMRAVLTGFAEVFSIRREFLQQQRQLALRAEVDATTRAILTQIGKDPDIKDAVEAIGGTLMSILGVQSIAFLRGSRSTVMGDVPDQAVLDALKTLSNKQPDTPMVVNNLTDQFPELTGALNGCSGALVIPADTDMALCFFRPAQVQTIRWAGNPEKTIGKHDGLSCLTPRASFSIYLETYKDRAEPWSELQLDFAKQVWSVLYAAERQALINAMNRHQELMIHELNHRVRNILALVRSVSRQARRRYGSVSSYSVSLEARIKALAAAHDLASASMTSVVGIREIIEAEVRPFEMLGQIVITGPNRYLSADVAPIYSLVVHELATNAAKYGALSVAKGQLALHLEQKGELFELTWIESGGPQVAPPDSRGFGSTLIENAVPHELGGTSSLSFDPDGVRAKISIPVSLLQAPPELSARNATASISYGEQGAEKAIAGDAIFGTCLVVEDNFILARDMADQMNDLGFEDTITASNSADALAAIEHTVPRFAVLDVNLGNGKTTDPVALKLSELNVPFIFVTGYGENADIDPRLQYVSRLAKPVSNKELHSAVISNLC